MSNLGIVIEATCWKYTGILHELVNKCLKLWLGSGLKKAIAN
jgi:hypothetical protein